MTVICGLILCLMGAVIVAAQVRACEYERTIAGPLLISAGAILLIGSIIEAVI